MNWANEWRAIYSAALTMRLEHLSGASDAIVHARSDNTFSNKPSRSTRRRSCMVIVSFEDVVCHRTLRKSEKYRLVLFPNEDREMRSAYHPGTNAFRWTDPFQGPSEIPTSSSPIRLMIELRSKGFPGFSGRKVSSYSLDLLRDCRSATFEPRLDSSREPSPPKIIVTVSVTGLAAQTRNTNEHHTPDAARRTPPIPSALGSSNTPDLRSPQATTSLSVPSFGPTVHVFDSDDARTKALSLSVAQNAFDSRDQFPIRHGPLSDLDLSTDVVPRGADAFGQAMWSGVSHLDAVVRTVSIDADIHPLVKGAWSLLNVAYTMAKGERELDLKIEDLIHALNTNCEFAQVLAEGQLEGAAANIEANILREVLNGASLIKEYCTTRRSISFSVFRLAGSTTGVRVDACLQTLEVFRRDLADHVVANVHRDLRSLALTLELDLKTLKAKFDRIDNYIQTQEDTALLNQMPFALEADRALRSRDRGCLPNTRVEIIDALINWAIGAGTDASQSYIKGLHHDARIVWLCGVAGSGKSSIAISVARALRSMDRLAALYGFERALQTTLNPTNLFSTIARQRAERRPLRKLDLLRALQQMQRELRATTDAGEQFKSFLATDLAEDTSAADDVIVIDAFDESGSTASRSAALRALSPESHNFVSSTHARIFITSRYDHDIAQRLERITSSAQHLISVVRMEDIRPADTERDIRLYVFQKLEGVVGLEAAEAAGEITELAMAAEHSFQWASTSCLYISQDDDDALRTPIIRLREILATRGGLYGLYLSILHQHFKSSLKLPPSATRPLRAILGSLVCALEPLSIGAIASLAMADLPSSEAPSYRLIARRLSSIVTGTHDESTPLIPLHTSFTDFLCDPEHSGEYAVAAGDVHTMFALACLTVMKRSLQFNICNLETSFLRNDAVPDLAERIKKHIPDDLSYACRFWPVHVAAALLCHCPETESLRGSLSAFLADKLLLMGWLEVMSLTGTDAYASLVPLASLQADNSDLSDLLLFIAYFSVPISLSVPQIYLSALAFVPSSSTVAPTSTRFPNLVRPDKPLGSWPRVRHKLEHVLEVQSVAWSPYGRWLVSGEGEQEDSLDDAGGAICLWDVYSGRLMLPRVSTTSAVLSVAVSTDGNLLASGHKDATVQLWDARTLAAKGSPLKGHSGFVRSVAFSSKDPLLASGSDDGTVVLWDIAAGSTVGDCLKGHSKHVRSVAFSPDGAVLLSSSSDQTVRLWDVRARSAMGDPLEGHTDSVRCGAFSPDGSVLASGSDDRTVRLWEVRSRTSVDERLARHAGSVLSVAFSPDSNTLASCSDDKTVRLWDVRTRSQVCEPLTGHAGKVVTVAFSPDGALLTSGSSDRTIHVWDVRVLTSNRESPATQFRIRSFAAFSPDRKLLASGSDGNLIQLWDVHSVSAVGEPLKGHSDGVNCVAFSPDGTLLASGANDKTVRLWDVRTGSSVGDPLRGHSDWVQAVAFSSDGKLLASGADDRTIRLWDVQSRSAVGEPLEGHTRYVLAVAFSPDGALLASGSRDSTVRLWDVRTRAPFGEPLEGHNDRIRAVAFSPDARVVASGSDDKTIRLWDVQTQSVIREPLEGHTRWVTSLAFSPDGELLASNSEGENVVRVWDVRAPLKVGAPVSLLRHETNVFSIAFAPASPLLSSITNGGVVRKWDLEHLLFASSSNASSNPENRPEMRPTVLRSDRPSLSALPPDFLLNLDDGWIVRSQKELVLWIPPALRPSIDDVRVHARFGGPPLVKLDFTNFVCGSDWTNSYSPSPTSVSNS